jgi:AraC family ethanolamine operon transcriptional activator
LDTKKPSVACCVRVTQLETADIDEQASALAEWSQIYQQLGAGSYHGQLTDVWFDGLQLFRERSNRVLHEVGMAWPGSITVGIPLSARGDSRFCGEPLGDADVLAVLGGEEWDFRTASALDLCAITVDPSQLGLDDQVLACVRRALRRRRVYDPGAHQLRDLRQFLVDTMDAADRGVDLHEPSLRATVGWHLARLLTSFIEELKPDAELSLGQRRDLVDRARALALAEPQSPVEVGELARRLGVSRRTLQNSFHAVVDTSPSVYLRMLRLNAARRDLRAGNGTVLDIAARWGFWHFSRFAGYYRQSFGELPSATLRQRH